MASAGLSSILVATDFSKGAQSAIERALTLPLAPKAKLTLVHVLHDDIPGTLRKQAIDEANANLEKLIARARAGAVGLGRGGLTLSGEVLEGSPATQVARRARALGVELVCLGRHGRIPVLDYFIGTTAQKVARMGDTPLLLVQADPDGAYSRVLVSVALGPQSVGVVKGAKKVLHDGAQLTLHHATKLLFAEHVNLPAAELAALHAKLVSASCDELAAVAKKAGVPDATLDVQEGDARSVILSEALLMQADLVVVGTKLRKGLERVLLGSVTEWVLTHAKTDVLVVRG